ncbi:lipopolysaccharide biosynthesis protein [Hymenobacter fodinae]|uniref:Lipopolysaccharide biosynthesis protein n=1 Tax=Hymenobacter fodinae TaxID=2510796 RepID=A0A4Z0PEW6_9BACT|nr:oligosaccharide flippase family protein [Hymenobacter fodinae]TGE10209.1 lipopolysaccharide biosynthesis protein [Hymenobacter fodinae]
MGNSLTSKIASFLSNKHLMSLTGNMTVQAINIVYFGLLFRYMKVEELGAYVFFNSVLGLADSLRAGFVTTAFMRWYCGAAAKRAAEVMGSTWVISIAITVLFGLLNIGAYLLSYPLANEGLNLFIKWSGLTLVCMLPSFVGMCVLQAEQRFDKLLYLRSMQLGLSVIGLFGLLWLQKVTVTNVVYTNLFAASFTSLVTLVAGYTRLGDIQHRSTECIRELANFGKYSVGSQIGATLFRNSDTFIINFMLGPAALAVYNLAQRFMIIIELLVGSSIATAMPMLSVAYNKNDKAELRSILTKNVGIVTWVLLPIVGGTILLAEIPIYILGGSKYIGTEAANLLRIFMAMAILFPIDRFTGITLEVINKPRLNLIKVFMMLAINVAGDFAGIYLFKGIYGVAIASFPTVLSGFLFGYLLLRKDLSLSLTEMAKVGLVESKAIITKFLSAFKRVQSV